MSGGEIGVRRDWGRHWRGGGALALEMLEIKADRAFVASAIDMNGLVGTRAGRLGTKGGDARTDICGDKQDIAPEYVGRTGGDKNLFNGGTEVVGKRGGNLARLRGGNKKIV